MEESIKENGWIKIGVSGAWAYKIEGEVDRAKPFPPVNEMKVEHIDMSPGTYNKLEELNKNLLDVWIQAGATHIMLCNGGEKAKVIEVGKLEADKGRK